MRLNKINLRHRVILSQMIYKKQKKNYNQLPSNTRVDIHKQDYYEIMFNVSMQCKKRISQPKIHSLKTYTQPRKEIKLLGITTNIRHSNTRSELTLKATPSTLQGILEALKNSILSIIVTMPLLASKTNSSTKSLGYDTMTYWYNPRIDNKIEAIEAIREFSIYKQYQNNIDSDTRSITQYQTLLLAEKLYTKGYITLATDLYIDSLAYNYYKASTGLSKITDELIWRWSYKSISKEDAHYIIEHLFIIKANHLLEKLPSSLMKSYAEEGKTA